MGNEYQLLWENKKVLILLIISFLFLGGKLLLI